LHGWIYTALRHLYEVFCVGDISTNIRLDFPSESIAKVFVEKIAHSLGCALLRDGRTVYVIVGAAEIETVTALANRLGGALHT
jgi:hypothetical protein